MDQVDYMNMKLFEVGAKVFNVEHFVKAALVLALIYFIYKNVIVVLLKKYFDTHQFEDKRARSIKWHISVVIFSISMIGVLWALEINYNLYTTSIDAKEAINIHISTIILAIIFLQVAHILDLIISHFVQSRVQLNKELNPLEEVSEQVEEIIAKNTAGNMIKYSLYIIAIILFLRNANLDYQLFSFQNSNLYISSFLIAILFVFIARFLIFVISELFLYAYFSKNKVNRGSQFAVNQLVKYVIYVISFLMVINALGVNMTVFFGAGAALLVGIGFALQQTFNDFFSGIILLFERKVEVGDVIVVESLVGTVKLIGLRTSIIETRANTTVVVPNSVIVSNNMVNWSHYDEKVRFEINVGVAYGTDTDKVRQVLIDVAKQNTYVLKYPGPSVFFTNFGESSLDFQLLFWSRNLIVIESIKSDLRFAINKAFKENEIEIPFPQRVVWNGVA